MSRVLELLHSGEEKQEFLQHMISQTGKVRVAEQLYAAAQGSLSRGSHSENRCTRLVRIPKINRNPVHQLSSMPGLVPFAYRLVLYPLIYVAPVVVVALLRRSAA